MSDLLNKASLVMIPSGYKEDVVYSAVPTDGSGDLSFTRASNGTRINSAGLVEVCPWNLMQQSNAFSTSPWAKSSTTLTSGQSDPNGGTSAWKVEFAGGGNAYLGQFAIGQIGVVTISAYFRADSTTTIGFNDGSAFSNSITIGTTWQRYEFSYTVSGGQCNMQIDNYFGVSPSGQAKTFYIYGAQLNIGSTAKPYFPTTDRLNVPRLTYQNGGGGCPSLLLEKQSTNLFSYSEQFDNSAWSKGLVSISANTTTSPDGTQNSDSIIDNTTNSRHVMEQAITGDLSISRAFSLYAKQNTLRYLYMSVTNAGDTHCYSAIFDLQSGTVSATKVNGSATITASIQSVGNGWYRCTITGTMTSGTATFYPLIGTSDRGGFTGTLINNNAPVYIGSGQSLFIWGAQLEASSYGTSYIPSTSSSATRVADVMSVNLPNTDMTFCAYLECEEAPLGTTSGDWLAIYSDISILGRGYGYANTFGFADAYGMGITSATKMVWKQESGTTAKLFKNGALVATSTTGTYSDPFNRFRIDGAYLDKPLKVKEFLFFQNNLTDAECAALTA